MSEATFASQQSELRSTVVQGQIPPAVAHDAPPRVIHVVERFGRTAVEGWLLQMLAYARKTGVPIDWTFFCIEGAGALDERVQRLGADLIHSPVPIGSKLAFVRALRSHLTANCYDVLHAHHDLVSAVYLGAATCLPIKRRIVHVHNADEAVLTPSAIKQAVFRPSFRRVCLTLADKIVANSKHCLDAFLAGRSRRPGRDFVHYYGIDPTPLVSARPDRAAVRRRHGLAEDARIVLFAGRMVPEKNPLFAVDVVAAMRQLDPHVVALFAGSGSLEDAVRERAGALGLEPWIRCLGWCDDVPELMATCDWFILPHPEVPLEGFGMAVVEAQLAGLRLLLSTGIADDPLLPTASVQRLSLQKNPRQWAAAAMELWAAPAPSREAAFSAFRQSPMAMDRALDDLIRLHVS
jgi:glycosyltransferase involved in cell wall biosynthesis